MKSLQEDRTQQLKCTPTPILVELFPPLLHDCLSRVCQIHRDVELQLMKIFFRS